MRNRIKEQNKRKNKVGSLSLATWLDCLMLHGFKCNGCGRRDCKLILDHVVSFHRGGTNELENIQPLCEICDNRKTKIESYLCSPNTNQRNDAYRLMREASELFNK
jgi:5-methylcytosine-specific restriction endonuclease McrA